MDLKNIRLTKDEADRIEWCHSILSEEQICDSQDEAIEMAAAEFYAPEADAELVRVLVDAIVRHNREKKQ